MDQARSDFAPTAAVMSFSSIFKVGRYVVNSSSQVSPIQARLTYEQQSYQNYQKYQNYRTTMPHSRMGARTDGSFQAQTDAQQ
jgi:hypothetical protein